MSGFEISTIKDVRMQEIARKCDANGDGIISGENENSVWTQANSSFERNFNGIQPEFDRITVGGVSMHVDDITSIEQDGKHYTVTCANGVVVEYDEQTAKRKDIEKHPGEIHSYYGAEIFAAKNENYYKNGTTYTHLRNFADGSGVKVTGTAKNDVISLDNAFSLDKNPKMLFSGIDGRGGEDTVYLSGATGVAPNGGKAPIKAEAIRFVEGSKNFSVQSETGKVENLNKKQIEELNIRKKEIKNHPKHTQMCDEMINHLTNHGCTNYELK